MSTNWGEQEPRLLAYLFTLYLFNLIPSLQCLQNCMDKLRAIKKGIDESWREMDQLENTFITDVEDPGR